MSDPLAPPRGVDAPGDHPGRPAADAQPAAARARRRRPRVTPDAPNPWVRSLDGRWRFRLVDAPGRAPKRFIDPDHRDRGLGRGRRPRALDDAGVRPPDLHERADALPRRPAGGARRTTRPGSTARRFRCRRRGRAAAIVLHVGAADSVLHVWVNGHAVGHQQGLAPRGRVRRHRARAQGREPAGADGRPVVRRELRRGPGPVVARRDRPRACTSPRPTPAGSRTCTRTARWDVDPARGYARTSGPRSASRPGPDAVGRYATQLETTGGRRVGAPVPRTRSRPTGARTCSVVTWCEPTLEDLARRAVVGRGAAPLPARRHPARRPGGACARSPRVHGRASGDRDPRPRAARQRRAGADPRRQPPRLRSRHGSAS